MSKLETAGFKSVSAYIVVESVEAEVAFLKNVFAASVREQDGTQHGGLDRAEAQIGEGRVIVALPEAHRPATLSTVWVGVDNVDVAFRNALEKGAKPAVNPSDAQHGSREAAITDPYGNTWWLTEDRPKRSGREIERRLRDQRRSRL